MKPKYKIKLTLTQAEKVSLKRNKKTIADIPELAIDEVEVMLNVTKERAKELFALAEFQTIPSIGIRFAEDLIFMGYYSIEEMKNKNGAELTDTFERKKGYWIDPCVEDQFRLVVEYANNYNLNKRWWDFTEERKKYRLEYGYPIDRSKNAWFEVK